jgi:putative phosphoribosyl transferase
VFRDRQDAGQRLGKALGAYRNEEPLILAIPRGGVEVGYHVAKQLAAQLAVLVVRKLPLPHNPEAGFGAIAEDGSTVMFERVAAALTSTVVEEIVREQNREIQRRIGAFRHGAPLPPIAGRTAILVDDGVAMGSTVRAGIALCRRQQAHKIVVAAPVAGPTTAAELAELADDVVILEEPPSFRAVAQVYRRWYDVPDEEVIAILQNFAHPQSQG